MLILALSLNNDSWNPMLDVLWPAMVDRKVPDDTYYDPMCHCGLSRGAHQRMTTACIIASSEWTLNEGSLSDSKRARSTSQAGQGPLGCKCIMTVASVHPARISEEQPPFGVCNNLSSDTPPFLLDSYVV